MSRLLVPTPEHYARMTTALRQQVAGLVADRLRAVEEARARLDLVTRPRATMRASDYTPEETREAAIVLQRIYADRYRDTDTQREQRRADLIAATRRAA